MRTNKEKYYFYYDQITAIEADYIKGVLKNPPKAVYQIAQIGRIDKYEVNGIGYRNKLWQEDKPTRIDVATAKEYFENIPEMSLDGIRLMLSHQGETCKTSCTIKLDGVGKRYHGSIESANKALERLLLEKKIEKELLENGHIKCVYCGKIVRCQDSVSHEIIFQDWNGYKKFVNRKTNNYCPTGCGGYDQMAHEG